MIRTFSLAVIFYLAVIAAAFGQTNEGVSFLVQTPGVASASGSFSVYVDTANPLATFATPTGPAGVGYLIPKPTGAGFYMVGSSSIQSIDGAFSTAPRVINGIAGPVTAAAVTPDGKYLLVGSTTSSGNGVLYFVNTTTDVMVGSGTLLPSQPGFQVGTTAFCPQCFIAISRDSTTAWVLTNAGVGSTLTSVNISTQAATGQLTGLGGGATSVTLSPVGLLYVTAVNRIYEITPATLSITPTGTVEIFFSPYLLHFTPDGTTAYVVNLVPTSGGSILQFSVATHQTLTWPSAVSGINPPTFSDVMVAGNSRIFAFDPALNFFTDVIPSPFSVSLSGSTVSVGANSQQFTVLSAAVSNELPSSAYAFLVVANGNQTNLYRMNLGTNTIGVENPNVPNYPNMQVVTVPSQNPAAAFLTFGNTNQTLLSGGAAVPLTARVLDSTGIPVFNAQVSFAETDTLGGAVITNASAITNADGYVTANVTIPNAAGTYTVTLTVGAATQVFSLTVPGANGGGQGGNGGGPTQVNIVTGDGQIILPDSASALPLTIQVTDTSGNPLYNIPVTFTLGNTSTCVLNGNSPLSNPTTTTDVNGLASSYFIAGSLIINATVLPCTVVATTQYGTATFTETIILISTADGSGLPEVDISQPTAQTGRTIIAPEGEPLPNAIVAAIHATLFPQTGQALVGVATYTYNANDPTWPTCLAAQSCMPAPATCVGSSDSDANGVSHCTLVSVCQLGNFALGVYWGVPYLQTTLGLQIVPGGPSMFNILAGNNQTGNAGTALSQTLTAQLTDACGNTVPLSTPVTWKVTSGSATLVNTVSATNTNGDVTTQVKLGQTPGPVTVTVTAVTSTGATITGTFTLANSVIVSSITLVSGSGQTAITGQPFAAPLVFLVKDNNNNPVSGITVTFTAVGNGTVSPSSVTTGANGQASTTVTAGASSGAVSITAGTASGASVSVSLIVLSPGPNVVTSSFVNAASFLTGLAPCGLGSIVKANVAPLVSGTVQASSFGPLPFQLAGFSMTLQTNGGAVLQVPISVVSNLNGVQQVNFQTPCELAPGLGTAVVTVNGATTTVNNIPILAASPGIFTTVTNGIVYGDVFSSVDGSYVTPTNYARRGVTYYVWVTGMGQTSPAASTDSLGVANQNTILQPIVGVNNSGVTVTASYYLPDQTGVYLIGFQIPQSFPTGPNQPLVVEVVVNGTPVFSNSVFLAGVQ